MADDREDKDEDRGKRGRRDFDDFFSGFGFDDDFQRIIDNMMNFMDEGFSKSLFNEINNPFVYGFSMRPGAGGKPVFQEFGNVPGEDDQVPRDWEPLVDVIDGEKEITVIVELPGVNKEDIRLNALEDHLSIKVDTESRRYHKELDLPAEVEPESVKATYKNGVLEVKLKRRKSGDKANEEKHRIDVG